MEPQAIAQTGGSLPRREVPTQGADWFTRGFRTEELAGFKLAMQARVVSMLVIAVLLTYLVVFPAVLYYEAILVLFVGMYIAGYMLNRRGIGTPWLRYLLIVLEFALLTFTLFVPNPLMEAHWPLQTALRPDPIVYYFLLLPFVAFSYSPRLMIWAGIVAAASWSIGVLWLFSQPDTITNFDHVSQQSAAEHLADHANPYFVDMHVAVQNCVLLLLVAGMLACVVWRSRRLVIRQAEAARERANLARYFSPNVLDEVMGADGSLAAVRKHEVAILFADIVGFTTLCETMPPEHVMELLREYHTRLEEQVFRFGGTLDKFIGDAVMASFGAPRPSPQTALNSLRCAHAMLRSMEDWNRRREAAGETPIRIGIGLHYGLAVMGDVGSARCAAFAVIGDTTNTTSRLQSLTRSLGTDIVVSHALMETARQEASHTEPELEGFVDAGPQLIRGRAHAIPVWTHDGGIAYIPRAP